jgi:putative copper export protein
LPSIAAEEVAKEGIVIKRILLFIALVAVVGTTFPGKAAAERCITGRVTALTATSISVYDRETTVTFSLDNRTRYTKWITKRPWQQSIQLRPWEPDLGQLVVVHSRHDDDSFARWVQVATDND